MIASGDFTYDHDGTWSNLILNLAPGVRLHASWKRGECPDPRVLIAFHLRHNQPCLTEAEVRDRETLLLLSHKYFFFRNASDLLNLSNSSFLRAAKGMIMEMDLPDSAVKIESWISEIINYAIMAAHRARAQKAELITIAIEFGCLKVTDSSEEAMNGGGEDCAICLNGLNETEIHVTLSCTHMFHSSCLGKWLEKKNQCTLCRSRVKKAKVFL